MKQKTFYPFSFFALIMVLIFSSCEKTGPAGPAGSQGMQGNPGPAGPQGDTGTANVIYSEWDSTLTGPDSYWSVPAITQGVLDSSVILVFGNQNGFVFQLPFDNVNGSGFYVNDDFSVGKIYIYCGTGYNLGDFQFRYVIIPGGVAATSAHLNYQQITSLFNITP
jgi:hypothetical protein